MLHELKTDEDFEIALKETNNFPTFLNVHFSILFQKTNRFPEVEWRNFWYQNSDGEKIYIIVRIYKDAPSRSFIIFCSKLTSKFNKIELWNIFDEIVKVVPKIFELEGPATIAYGIISDTYKEWYFNRFPSMDLEDYPCCHYYMTKKQQEMLLDDCQNGILLPEGYYFDKADVEKDSERILNTWRHAAPGDLETTKAKIRRLPSSLVREKESNEAIAFEVVEASGFMNHLFTFVEHRNKGIGSAVEKDLGVKLIRENITPYKTVELFNKDVLASSDRSKYWTRWNSSTDEDKPIIVTFHKHIFKITN